jgi:hypothetical protein
MRTVDKPVTIKNQDEEINSRRGFHQDLFPQVF